jgi:iron complex transport system permease protein
LILDKRTKIYFLILLLCLPSLIILQLFSGELNIDFSILKEAFFSNSETSATFIIREVRIPRICMAIFAGGGLSIAGLLMQTLFNNPLAGPYVLGINAGASLFVALGMMLGTPLFFSEFGTIGSALLGAFCFGLLILLFSTFVRSYISLLLIGIMLGSFTSAFISILQSISDVLNLKQFTMWSMGSLQQVELQQIPILFSVFMIGILGCLFLVKPLNALVLGEQEASYLGINMKRVRISLIAITAILTGIVTAYCGPIAFVGLAVPNIAKILFKTQNHKTLIVGSFLIGAIFLLTCDLLIQEISLFNALPINALTSIIGAPFVIYIVLKRIS